MNNYIIVLGSNLSSEFGSSTEILKKCVGELKSFQAIQSLLESKWYISSSFVDKSEPRYVNVGIRFCTNLKPKELLNFTSDLEIKYGRKRQRRWEPRTCDIDILLCDQFILPSKLYFEKWLKLDFFEQKELSPDELILPHPRLQERAFFLKPLNDLQPDWTHPFLEMKAKEMLDSLPSNELQNIEEMRL
ncbi:MAG: 2-amino-4-hydroxy-6-hydroxymethyldihydropteridine diphosphokinase [Paracoccaceae bacterium]